MPASLEELLMTSDLDDASGLENDDSIRRSHRAQPVGDNNRRAPLHQKLQGVLQLCLSLGIHVRGGLVENQNARVGKQRSRKGDELSLTSGKIRAALGEHRRVP